MRRTRLAGAIVLGLAVSIYATASAASPGAQASPAGDPAAVPTKTKQAKTLQTVQVTASRIPLPSLTVPTPQVPVPRAVLNLNARTNVAASLDDLPYFSGGTTPQNGATNSGAGNSGVDLRGLGSAHTLTLLDGHRFIGSGNLNTIPSVLVKRVQVVTGGASATWGSGAVAGVVNVILKNHIQGLTIGGTIGLSSAHDARERKFELADGTSYGGGKGHFTFGFNYVNRDKVWPRRTKRDGISRWQLVPLPNGGNKIFPDVGQNNEAVGGVILNGVLKGKAFNPNGTLRNAALGTPISGTTTSGFGDPNVFDYAALVTPLKVYSALARTRYNLSNDVQFTAQVRHSRMWNKYPWFNLGDSNIPISIDNAFLPSAVKQVMEQNNETSFTMGRVDKDIGIPVIDFSRETTQVTFGLNGLIGDWHWNTYASYGRYHDVERYLNSRNVKKFGQAVDAVIDPVTDTPVCRVALTDPSTDCVPINLFGRGNASQSALNYVFATTYRRVDRKLAVYSAELEGSPVQLPAGPVHIAVGADWRYNSSRTWVLQSMVDNDFYLQNGGRLHGHFNVKEAFGEIFVPVVKDVPVLQNLGLDAAARYSSYSTTGTIWSWKIGMINDFGGGFRARADYSQDIRAPSITELFTPVSGATLNPIVDPVKHVQVLVRNISGGNVNLQPEVAKTFTGGVSWSPPSISNLAMSLDYYNLNIKDIITTLGAQTIVNQCFKGDQTLCARVTRDAAGNLLSVSRQFLNLATYKENGIDVDFSYHHQAALFGTPGEWHFRVLGTWVHKLITNNGVIKANWVGSVGNGQVTAGVPRWKGVGSVSFDSKKFSLHGRVRYIGAGYYDTQLYVVNGHIPQYFYFDAGATYNVAKDVTLHFNVINLANKQPPHGSATSFSDYYHSMGRYYTLGVRVKLP